VCAVDKPDGDEVEENQVIFECERCDKKFAGIEQLNFHRCQFHQHFTRAHFVQKCFLQIFSNDNEIVSFRQKNIGTNAACNMLTQMTTGWRTEMLPPSRSNRTSGNVTLAS